MSKIIIYFDENQQISNIEIENINPNIKQEILKYSKLKESTPLGISLYTFFLCSKTY